MKPQFKDKAKSIQRAESLLSELKGDTDIDLVVLPEMALVGYRFDDKEDVLPFCEQVPADIDGLIGKVDALMNGE